ncbi:MAG TPA: hypothetical protein VHV49_02150 [Pseudonocardiaceae bacterium]|jgi:hypothetical protein|nr:hypothetical protein [Pseudonocardiaceae bacterium]
MPTVDQAWAWVALPVRNLRANVLERPNEPWDQRREGFRTELASATRERIADELITWLDELSDSDRNAILDTDELPNHVYAWLTEQLPEAKPAATQPAAQQQAGYDETAWYAHLAENGSRWDGSEQNWTAFRDWFRYYATDAGFGAPATQLLDYLQPMTPGDRVTTLGQYGVTIQPPAQAAPEPDDLPVVTAAAQQIMDEVVDENPEFADIPEERRIELTRMWLAEMESQS